MKHIFKTWFLLLALITKGYSQSAPAPTGQVVSDLSEILSSRYCQLDL